MLTLTQEETDVLRLRFDHPRRVATREEVAGLLGLPLSTMRRIERRALRKLRMTAIGPVGEGFDGWDEA